MKASLTKLLKRRGTHDGMPVGYVDFDISIVKRMLVISQTVHATMVSRTIFGLLRAIEFSNLQPLLSDFRLMAYWGESL